MKTRMAIFFLVIIPFTVLSQTITPQERERYIAALDSADENIRLNALREILENGISEALPKIEQNFWKENVTCQEMSLMAMESFGSANLHSFAKSFFDSAEVLARKPFMFSSALEIKVEAAYYLEETGDYSGTQYVFDLLRRSDGSKRVSAQKALKGIAQHVPAYADSAKVELLNIVRQDPFWFSRIKALDDLVEIYGEEMMPEIVAMATDGNAPTEIPRMHALDLLFKMNYDGLHGLLEDRLSIESAPSYRGTIADSLLNHFGGMEDYLFVRNYVNQEPDGTIKLLLGVSLRDFKPPVPSPMKSVSVLLDSIISMKRRAITLGWLADMNFEKELDNGLTNARKHLLRGDSVNCAREVKTFKDKVNAQYQATVASDKKNQPRDKRFVTVEAWKFLYYNAQYILDRLPTSN